MSRNYNKSYNLQKSGILRSKRRYNWKFFVKVFYFVSIPIAISSLIYFLIFSYFFRIREVVVVGNSYIASSSIVDEFWNIVSEKYFYLFRNDNINILRRAELKQKLMDKFSRIDSMDIKKDYPDKIIVNIKEKEAVEILCPGQLAKCFYIDKNGIAFDEAVNTEGFLIIKILDNRGYNVELNKRALYPEFINFVGKIKDNFRDATDSSIKSFILVHPSQREVTVLADNYKVIFDVSVDTAKQLMVLKETMMKEIKDQKNKLDYIDLRVEGRAYYKLK